MTSDEDTKAIMRGMVRVALYHKLPKSEWMAKVVPRVEEHFGEPLSEEVVDQIHQAFKEEMSPEMAIEEVCCFNSSQSVFDELAENLSVYAANPGRDFHPEAAEVLRQFRAVFGRDPIEYVEIETFFYERQLGKHLKIVPSADQ